MIFLQKIRSYLVCLCNQVGEAIVLVFNETWSKWVSSIVFSIFFTLHLIILPADIIGPEIGLLSFQYISPRIAVFAFLFALLESILICLWFYLFKHKSRCKTAPAAGGMLIGIISPLLCCTPLLPAILSFIAILFPSIVSGMGLTIQYTVNVYQTELLISALLLLQIAVIQNAKHLVRR